MESDALEHLIEGLRKAGLTECYEFSALALARLPAAIVVPLGITKRALELWCSGRRHRVE